MVGFAFRYRCERDHCGKYFLIMRILASNFQPLLSQRTTLRQENLVTEPHVGYSKNQIATVVALDTNHANAFVTAGVEKFCPQSDQRGQEGEMHDVFIVISEGRDGEHIARTFYAADLDDARQTHRDNYADEPLVAVHQ